MIILFNGPELFIILCSGKLMSPPRSCNFEHQAVFKVTIENFSDERSISYLLLRSVSSTGSKLLNSFSKIL